MLERFLKKRNASLQGRFIARVLIPPFVALIIMGGLGFWQLDRLLSNQAIESLHRSAQTSSLRLEREFEIRKTILTRTGNELFVSKSKYLSDVAELEKDRAGCRDHFIAVFSFDDSPNDVCHRFLDNLAGNQPSLQVIEDTYVNTAQNLQQSQRDGINQRLSAFKQFFPETLALVVLDNKEQVVSSAVSGAFEGSVAEFIADAQSARQQELQGRILKTNNFDIAIFAYPITDGSVLAAYDVNNREFINDVWAATPINSNEALAIILDGSGAPIYPGVEESAPLVESNQALRSRPSVEIELGGVRNIAVGEVIAGPDWLVVVASPKAAVLASIRDAQLLGAIVISTLIVGFLWVGTYFIRRTANNLTKLVTGAMIYGSGRLDYKIDLKNEELEFKKLADTMNYMAARIAQTEKQIDEKNKEFISVATHELRAPMTAIIGHLSMFKEQHDGKLDKNSQLFLDQAYNGTAKLRDLINDMLDVARLEGGKVELDLQPHDISTLVKDVMQTMEPVAEDSNITLSYDDSHAAKVLADKSRLTIILNNLVSNAIKYNKKSGFVKVTHKNKKGYLELAVTDSGLGIPKDQQEHMFQKFFRVSHADRASVVGTGLGMHITKRYVEEMDGNIWFESTHGKGTTFFVSLPIGTKADAHKKVVSADSGSSESGWIMKWRRRLR